MPPFTGRTYDLDAGNCAFRLEGCHEAKKGAFVCKNCWASADLHQQEDLKRAYPEEDFCHGLGCWEKPLLGPSRDMYCTKCKKPGRSRSRSMTSSRRRETSGSTTTSSAASSRRALIPRSIMREMESASRDEIEAMIVYGARLLRQ